MKRLIQSIIHDGFYDDNKEYIEVYKNPTQDEIERTLKIVGNIRGLLYKDGTIYIWPSSFEHPFIKNKGIKMDFSQYHFFTDGKNSIRFHMNNNFIKDIELLKAIDLSQNILSDIINLDSCIIEIFNYRSDDFKGTLEELKELNMTKVSRLIKASQQPTIEK